MNLLKLALRRIAVRNLDKNIVKTFNNVVDSKEENNVKDYIPNIPKISDIFKSIGLSILVIFGIGIWSFIIYLILSIFFSINISILISLSMMLLLVILLFLSEISISKIPSQKEESLFVKDNRYKDKKRFSRYISIPDYDNMIIFNKKQNNIKIISSLIKYLPTIILIFLFCIYYFL